MYTKFITYDVIEEDDNKNYEEKKDIDFVGANIDIYYHIEGTDHDRGYCTDCEASFSRDNYFWKENNIIEEKYISSKDFSLDELILLNENTLKKFNNIHEGCTYKKGSGCCRGMRQIREATDIVLKNIIIKAQSDKEINIFIDEEYQTFSYKIYKFIINTLLSKN